jgi:hypothetical protein
LIPEELLVVGVEEREEGLEVPGPADSGGEGFEEEGEGPEEVQTPPLALALLGSLPKGLSSSSTFPWEEAQGTADLVQKILGESAREIDHELRVWEVFEEEGVSALSLTWQRRSRLGRVWR